MFKLPAIGRSVMRVQTMISAAAVLREMERAGDETSWESYPTTHVSCQSQTEDQ